MTWQQLYDAIPEDQRSRPALILDKDWGSFVEVHSVHFADKEDIVFYSAVLEVKVSQAYIM